MSRANTATNWPMVPLSEVLTHYKEYIDAPEFKMYPKLSVRLYGKGVVLDTPADGATLKMRRHQIAKSGQVILSEIWGKKGAIGFVPPEGDGALCTSHFFLFDVHKDKVLPGYLAAIFKGNYLESRLGAQARGTTGYAAVRPKHLLAARIPLPPLAEQRRIVARIEELAAKVEAAQTLREETIDLEDKLMGSAERGIWPDSSFHDAPSLSDVTTYLARGRQSKQGSSNHYLVKTRHVQMGKYVRSRMTLDSEVAAKVKPEALLRQGDVLVACSAAGCLGRVAFYNDTERMASTDTHVAIARADTEVILPEYLYAYLRGAQGQFQLRSRERGDWRREKIGFRLTELNLSDLKRVPVPLPSLSEQRRIVAYLEDLQAKVDAVRQHQAATAGALDALLPSILDQAFKGEL